MYFLFFQLLQKISMIISFSIIVQPDHEHQNVITIEDLLYSFISHLGSSKTLQ